MVECEFTGGTRIDTTLLITADSTWILGGDTVALVYANDVGDELAFEAERYEYSYTERSGREACGECGDTIPTITVIPHMSYEAIANNGFSLSINFESDFIITLNEGLYQCVKGEISLSEPGIGASSVEFVADCKGSFTQEDEEELNLNYFELRKTLVDTVPGVCQVDSGFYYRTMLASPLSEISIGYGVPVQSFRWNGTCWNFKESRPK